MHLLTPAAPTRDRLLTMQEVESEYHLSVRTLRNARDRYGLPVVKIGAAVRIRESALEAWLEAQTEVRAA